MKDFLNLLEQKLDAIPVIPILSSADVLDKTAQKITTALQESYGKTAKHSLEHGIGQPWWNEDYKHAVQDFRRINRYSINTEAVEAAKKSLRSTLRKAKREFFRRKLDDASTGKDIFDMTNWHKSTDTYQSPPLRDSMFPNSPPASSPEAKREVLARNLLQNVAEVEDIPLDAPSVASATLSFPEITATEIRSAVLNAANTSPGSDEVPTTVIRVAWPLIEIYISSLYRACLNTGHHPACFRSVVLAILAKPNKTDRSSPRSYQPIALLSVLGKRLKRLIARRLSWIAVKHKVLTTQHFGALPLRSAVDLTTCLTHDVEQALNQKFTATLLTLDIKGAFNAVLPGRLIRRLRKQGWPDPLVRWVASFTTKRIIKIRLDSSVRPSMEIDCGLPQSSPTSPILFALYIAPLFWMGRRNAKYGYADDVGLLATSPSLQANCNILTKHLQEALEWGHSEGITFDPAKSELIHFSRRRDDFDPTETPTITSTAFSVSEDSKRPYLR